jgi:hypothetical protein
MRLYIVLIRVTGKTRLRCRVTCVLHPKYNRNFSNYCLRGAKTEGEMQL